MKRIRLILFISCFVYTLAGHAQMAFAKEDLIGTWELDYSSAKACVGGFPKPIIIQGQALITFTDANTYTTFLSGNASNGYFSIDPSSNDILFDPLFDQATVMLKPYRMKVASIEEGVLTFLIQGTCGIFEQSYTRVKSPR